MCRTSWLAPGFVVLLHAEFTGSDRGGRTGAAACFKFWPLSTLTPHRNPGCGSKSGGRAAELFTAAVRRSVSLAGIELKDAAAGGRAVAADWSSVLGVLSKLWKLREDLRKLIDEVR